MTLPASDLSPTQPLAFRRSRPAEALGACEIARMNDAIRRIAFAPDDDWQKAANGDAAAAIHLSLRLLPLEGLTPRADLVMTALALCAANANPAASLVLAKLLRLAPIDKALSGQFAVSWLCRNLIGVPVAGLQTCEMQICEVRIYQPITQEHPLPPLADDGRRA